MYDKDELIKRLRELQTITEHCDEQPCDKCENIELCDKHDNKTLSGTYKDAADAIEELQQIAAHYEETAKDYFKDVCYYLERVPKWIPVAERKPEHGWYLAYGPTIKMEVLHFHSVEEVWSSERYYNIEVTHWMPLPEPPQNE